MTASIGVDVSTQGVKAVAIGDDGRIEARASAAFDEPFVPNDNPAVREADPLKWLKGTDRVMSELAARGVPVGSVPLGGSAQQHGTVYTAADGSLSRRLSPIWMDTSARREADELERHFGEEMLRRTGSRAQARFAAAQILKFSRVDPAAFGKTARIDLVSSYVCRHLTGRDEIDFSDAAGMNLLNLETGDWDRDICDYISKDLIGKLPRVSRKSAFTGDNPATLVGCGADRPGCAVISLGTSDVFMAAAGEDVRPANGVGHVFGNPSGGLMALVCVKNGSLARDRVRRELGVNWAFFDETAWNGPKSEAEVGQGTALSLSLSLSPRAFPYFEEEITPPHPATGIEANFDWTSAASDVKVRAIVEGQIANLHEQTRWAGTFKHIILAGGASRSAGIRRTIERIFGAETSVADVADAAALGAALIAQRNKTC